MVSNKKTYRGTTDKRFVELFLFRVLKKKQKIDERKMMQI